MRSDMAVVLEIIEWLVAHPPVAAVVVYAIMSLITYGVYAHDKHAAETGSWRTPESTLHLLELCCGWPGAMLAQRRIHHKCSKFSYQIEYWLMIILNVAFRTVGIPATGRLKRRQF